MLGDSLGNQEEVAEKEEVELGEVLAGFPVPGPWPTEKGSSTLSISSLEQHTITYKTPHDTYQNI